MEASLVSSLTCWGEQELQRLPLSLQMEAALAPSVDGDALHIAWLSPPPGLGKEGGWERAWRWTSERSDRPPVVGLRLITEPSGLRSVVATGEPAPSCVAGDISGCHCPANQ